MTPNEIDLLPSAARDRVLRAKKMGRATRTALGLVLIGAVAAAGAEAARMDAFERVDVARLAAARTAAADEARARHERAIDSESVSLGRRLADVYRVPVMALLAAATAPLPDSASLRRVHFEEHDGELEMEIEVNGTDISVVADALKSVEGSFEVTTLTPVSMRVVIPRDRVFKMSSVSKEDSVVR